MTWSRRWKPRGAVPIRLRALHAFALARLLSVLVLPALLLRFDMLRFLHEGLNVYVLLVLLLLFDNLLELLHLSLHFGVLFLLHDQLLDEELPVNFLVLVVGLELRVLLDE